MIYLIYFPSGAAWPICQVLWTRWLPVLVGSSTLSVSVGLAAFIAGLTLGGWAGALNATL